MIMKQNNTDHCYSSPEVGLMAFASEQAVMTGSISSSFQGINNETFKEGGSFSDWI